MNIYPQQWFEIAESILRKHLGEEVNNLLRWCAIEQSNDPTMHKYYDVVHMDIYVFGSII